VGEGISMAMPQGSLVCARAAPCCLRGASERRGASEAPCLSASPQSVAAEGEWGRDGRREERW
jgi:hypothetical protein